MKQILRTVDDIANELIGHLDNTSPDKIMHNVIQMVRDVETFKLKGENKKEIILFAVEKILHNMENVNDEFKNFIKESVPDFIDDIVSVASSPQFKKVRGVFKCCK